MTTQLQKNQVVEDTTDRLKNQIITDRQSLEVVNFKALNRDGYIKPPYDTGPFAEVYRSIKWQLLGKTSNTKMKSILVLSSLPKEGASAVAFNLANSIGLEREWQSILVDTTANTSSLTNVLSMGHAEGLTDYLDYSCELVDILYPTTSNDCYFVPIGQHSNTRSELLASQTMKLFKFHLDEQYPNAFVILDTHAASQTADYKILLPLVDKVLIVVQSTKTQRSFVHDLIRGIPKEKIAGVVMTQDQWT